MGNCPQRYRHYTNLGVAEPAADLESAGVQAGSSNQNSFIARQQKSRTIRARQLSGAIVEFVADAKDSVMDIRRVIAERLKTSPSRVQISDRGCNRLSGTGQIFDLLTNSDDDFADDVVELSIILLPMPDSIYVCGGTAEDGQSLKSVERWDPELMLWETVAPMAQARDAAAGAASGRSLFVFGGVYTDESGVVTTASVEMHNPDSNEWKSTTNMEKVTTASCAAAVDGTIFLCGGEDGQAQQKDLRAFDASCAAWSDCPCMLHARSGACMVALGTCIYVFGGHSDVSRSQGVCADRYDTVTKTWQLLPQMNKKRCYAGAAVLNGKIYVCGGWTGISFLSSVESFDPIHLSWEELPDMLQARAGLSVASLGKYLYAIAGAHYDGPPGTLVGIARFQKLRSVERFDPCTATWEALPDLLEARYRSVAITLSTD